jgi:hypothetical protein
MNEDRVTETARKEQLVILVSMVCGYAALVPTDGNLGAAVTRLLHRGVGAVLRRGRRAA